MARNLPSFPLIVMYVVVSLYLVVAGDFEGQEQMYVGLWKC